MFRGTGPGGRLLHADNTLMPSTLHHKGRRGGRSEECGVKWRKNGKSQIIRLIEHK